jgi:shikimate dehydrogenase
MVDGKTNLVGIMGYPLGHSLSPVLHNAAFNFLKMNWCYVALPVLSSHLEEGVRGLGALGFKGGNVTIPHKETCMQFLDRVSDDAKDLGAVNTIVVKHDEESNRPTLWGTNTDWAGFRKSLHGCGFQDLAPSRALVVGAGGAASAVVYALGKMGTTEVKILNRSQARTARLVERMQNLFPEMTISNYELTDENLINSCETVDLFVNTTPLGTTPNIHESIWPDEYIFPKNVLVYDLVYNPTKTQLIRLAEKSGAPAVNGLEMLVQQAAIAFELWTDHTAPVAVMRNACEKALEN